MAFWRRKKDEFVSLGLSRAASERAPEPQTETKIDDQPAPLTESDEESQGSQASTPWQTSVLGLDLSQGGHLTHGAPPLLTPPIARSGTEPITLEWNDDLLSCLLLSFLWPSSASAFNESTATAPNIGNILARIFYCLQ